MSISRKNWSALSSLASQWSREDEEEVEREKRRRVRGSSSTADLDPDVDLSRVPRDGPISPNAFETDSTSETSQELTSLEQIQVDFVEMLRLRDEKRRMRHLETLRRQKKLEEEEAELSRGGGGEGARVEILGDLNEDQDLVFTSKPQPPQKTAPYSPDNSNSSCNTSRDDTDTQHGNRESTGRNPEPKPGSNTTRKFVSSLSISLDQTTSGCRTPTSSSSPTTSVSPREHWPTPCQSPPPRGAQSTIQNGLTQANNVSSNGNFEPTAKPAFVRHSSRTISFRMMRKKEEEIAPLQRSASVRMASKKFESTEQHEEEDKASSFQRNSRHRISSKSIQEKMERLAQAAQKSSEMMRSPDVAQRTLFLMDEVSRKRGLFEKEQQAACPTSPGVSRPEFKRFTTGVSDRINRWLNKTNQTGSSQCPADLKNVDINTMKSMFESSGIDSDKIHK